jgi:hypothetical protein
MIYSGSTIIMYCLQAFILMLALCNSAATEAPRRSLNNIFNRTSRVQPDVSTFTSTNVTKINGANARYETSDTITPQRHRRLGVGARYTGKKPSDDFIEGNENMHRLFDKVLMSMVTEVSCLSIQCSIRRSWYIDFSDSCSLTLPVDSIKYSNQTCFNASTRHLAKHKPTNDSDPDVSTSSRNIDSY